MNSQWHQRCIIIHALQWVDAKAIEGLYLHISPKTQIVVCFTVDALIEALDCYKHAPVVLGVAPHESIFLLARLASHLQQHRTLFFGRQFNYVDRQAPFYFLASGVEFYAWKDKSLKEAQIALLDFILHKKSTAIMPEYISQPPRVLRADVLISHVNRYLYLGLPHWGVREQSRRVLVMLAWGGSTIKIADTLGVSVKTVSAHKLFGLACLDMGIGSDDIYRGIVAKEILQRYAFTHIGEEVPPQEVIRGLPANELMTFVASSPVSTMNETLTSLMTK
ncbi:LuxR C-terminal-related transcriptional regulator [Salmonella enterica]|uniref:LuxR C-terminal-related transcriptional regulator n=1 Tax=Salmonella enterica TaxID=28901 RepID=UPI0009AEC78C|nr:LuxR C-terminal-related transcriptional regulator [Salmonella enterica]